MVTRPDWSRWERSIPDGVLDAARASGPLPRTVVESAEEAAERARVAASLRSAAYTPPAGYASAAYRDLDHGQPREVVQGWLGSGRLHLVLTGPVGTGKTHAVHSVCRDAVSRGLWTLHWSASRFLVACRPDGDPSAERRARACDVLALDDVGGQKPSDWASDLLSDLLDERLYECRRTLVSTNLTHDQLVAVLGERFADRLRQSMVVAKFTGQSRRRDVW